MGAHNGAGESAGLERLAAGFGEVLNLTSDLDTPILLESTAGQGTCLGYRFEHLAFVIENNAHHPRLQICLDTCHLYAAGYDLSTPEGYQDTWQEFEKHLDRKRLRAIHLNDSLNPLGKRVDRHHHIGEGHLGKEAFRLLLHDLKLKEVPMYLETPQMETMHQVNLERLKKLREEQPS